MLSVQDLVDNGTVTAEGADLLRTIGSSTGPFIVYSLPRNAGKSTVTEAILAEAPPGTPRHDFLGTETERDELLGAAPAGYLVVAEMGHRGRPGYLAGDEIERAFEVAEHGYRLATSLHADDVGQLVEVLAANGISAERLRRNVRYLVKVQPLGDPFAPDTKRIVEAIDETTPTDGGFATRRLYG